MSETPDSDPTLSRRLREADGDRLHAMVEEHLDALGIEEVRQATRNPFVSRETIALLGSSQRLLGVYEVRRLLARHPRAPQILAQRLIPGLFWRDLLEIAGQVRVRPAVRRSAERVLAERLPSLSIGEKMSIARRASTGLLGFLRHDPNPQVIGAMLENPRLTEGVLVPLVSGDGARPEILKKIADNPRWGRRYEIRLGLSRNPRTPLPVALRLLSSLKKPDLRSVAANHRLPQARRQRAKLLSGAG